MRIQEEAPRPPHYPPSSSSSPSHQPWRLRRQVSEAEAQPRTPGTSQQPQMHQKGAIFDLKKTGKGGEEGLHGMEGQGGAAKMMNPSLSW